MSGRMSRRIEHDDAAVAEHILVARYGFHGAAAADPVRHRRGVRAGRRRRGRKRIPIAFADQERRLRKGCGLADVIAVIVADADELDLFRLQIQLSKLLDQTGLDCGAGRLRPARVRGGIAGVPDQVLLSMTDQVAARGQLQLPALIGVGVRKARDIGRAGAAAAIEARERHFRSGLSRCRDRLRTPRTPSAER